MTASTEGRTSLVAGYLQRIADQCADDRSGKVADYIPELAAVDPDQYGLSLCAHDGYLYSVGDTTTEFTIQSMSKPLTYAMVLGRHGSDVVDAKIGVEPSGEAFNEISVDSRRRPRNPMINAGAITAASLLLPQHREVEPGVVDEAFTELVEFYSACAGRRLTIDDEAYLSEKSTGSRNRAIAYMLDSFGVLGTDPDAALDLYFRQCSLRVTTEDLAVVGVTIACGGVNPRTGRRVFSRRTAQRLLSVMTTCGMYDGAGDWVTSVGIPAKSGVGGGILGSLPGQLGIGVFSPRLDDHGNSVRGVDTYRHLSADLGLHMFNITRESRVTIRAVYDIGEFEIGTEWTGAQRARLRGCRDRVRVYELQGDLTFSGAESVLRRIDLDIDACDIVIVEISRIDVIDPVARRMVLGAGSTLAERGKRVLLVDPDGVVREGLRRVENGSGEDSSSKITLPHVHSTMEAAVADAESIQLEGV
ncbi:MAG: glutaminase A [Gordonia amarae]